MDEQEKLARAKRQVAKITAFYAHLAAFALVMTALFIVNRIMGGTWWVQWPFLAWGVGVLVHGLCALGRLPRMISDWQVRKIKEIKDKM